MTMDAETPTVPASPYGIKPTRWIRPVVLALLLVAFDEQGVIAFLLGVFLVLVYLPRSLWARKYAACRRERLQRLAIYLAAIAAVIGLRIVNTGIGKQRADAVVAAVERFHAREGKYPERLDQLVPDFLPEVPAKAKLTLMDSGFRYRASAQSHSLSYVIMPPFGRREYQFETRSWSDLD